MSTADVVIVGGGPAGLSAAIELRRRGAGRVVVFEREPEPGGAPRHTAHLGFGMLDRHRLTTGPRYAAALTRRAEKAGVEIEVGRSVRSITDGAVATTGATGPSSISAGAIVLATGVRERPRSARLVPGDRPAGIYTTGSLQQFTAIHHQRVGTSAVIVGAEDVSCSAVLTLRHAGCTVEAMVTPLRDADANPWLRRISAGRLRVPVLTGVGLAEITGRGRVEAVVLTDGRRIPCDAVVFTGDWVPEYEVPRLAGLAMRPDRAPLVDEAFHTSQPGVFAIGNLVHPARASGICALDGRHVAVPVMDHLHLPT